jgi:ClpP class serine protease
MSRKDRLEAWLAAGMPDDIEELEKFGIKDKDIKTLEKRVMAAVHRKMTEREGVFTFAEHRTLQ